MIGRKPLRIRFNKVDRFYDGARYLLLLHPEKYDTMYNGIRCCISQESGIAYVFSHGYAAIKIDSYDSLSLEKTLALHNVIILIKPVFNKNQNHSCNNIFLDKCSH